MKDKEFKISYTRGTGPGGQHKNKVETCVLITHIPTGLTERCQDTRSKKRNLTIAKERIIKKIEQAKQDVIDEKKKQRRLFLIKNSIIIRTYNYIRNIVTDHRTSKRYNLKNFMEGKIDLSETSK